jgi:hypothetical protein
VGGGGGGGFQVVFGVESGLFTFHLDRGLSMQDFIFLEGAAGGVKAISFQVSDMFPKMFPLALHFYPICFGKCCPSFT